MRLTSNVMGEPHNITIPAHKSLKSGTLSSVLRDVASYLQKSKITLQDELFPLARDQLRHGTIRRCGQKGHA